MGQGMEVGPIPNLTSSLVGFPGAPPGPLPQQLVLTPGPGRPWLGAQGHSQGLGWYPPC